MVHLQIYLFDTLLMILICYYDTFWGMCVWGVGGEGGRWRRVVALSGSTSRVDSFVLGSYDRSHPVVCEGTS